MSIDGFPELNGLNQADSSPETGPAGADLAGRVVPDQSQPPPRPDAAAEGEPEAGRLGECKLAGLMIRQHLELSRGIPAILDSESIWEKKFRSGGAAEQGLDVQDEIQFPKQSAVLFGGQPAAIEPVKENPEPAGFELQEPVSFPKQTARYLGGIQDEVSFPKQTARYLGGIQDELGLSRPVVSQQSDALPEEDQSAGHPVSDPLDLPGQSGQ